MRAERSRAALAVSSKTAADSRADLGAIVTPLRQDLVEAPLRLVGDLP
jgi:hypothetical protein